MAASVLYYGPDKWNRVMVLESAGYTVQQCAQISDLESVLDKPAQPQVVVINSSSRASFRPAIDIIHAKAASAPIVVFPSPGQSGFEQTVDLVVPPLTPAVEWLGQMAELLVHSRAVREDAIAIQETSATLLRQSVVARAKSAATRAKSAEVRIKAAASGPGFVDVAPEGEKAGHVDRVAGSTRGPDSQDKS